VRARHGQLTAIKAKLAADAELGPRVHRYTARWDKTANKVAGLEAWGEEVFQHLWRELEAEVRATASRPAPTRDDLEREALAEFVEHRSRGFVGWEDLVCTLIDLAHSPPAEGACWGACITGAPGSGKSALFAHLVREPTADRWTQHCAGGSGNWRISCR